MKRILELTNQLPV